MSNNGPTCPLCGGLTAHLMQLPHTSVRRCAAHACTLEFVEPQLDDRELASAYAKLYYPAQGGSEVLANTSHHDARDWLVHIASCCEGFAGKSILDYGCGVGTLLQVLRELGARTTGIELSAEARATTEQNGLGPVYRDIAALRSAQPEARFDVIVLSEVIEHLRRPWDDLAQLATLLSPAGTLAAKTPNASCLHSRLAGKQWDQRNNVTHFYFFNAASLQAAFRRAGLGNASEVRPALHYAAHGFLRRNMQDLLRRFGWQGGLTVVGSVNGPTRQRTEDVSAARG